MDLIHEEDPDSAMDKQFDLKWSYPFVQAWKDDEQEPSKVELRLENGAIYHGTCESGILTGSNATLQWTDPVTKNKCEWKGDFNHNHLTGSGTLQFGEDGIYEGSLVKGIRHGFGMLRYSKNEGAFFRGQWKNGLRDGFGFMDFGKRTGNIHCGGWVSDQMDGAGVFIWNHLPLQPDARATVFIGQFARNQRVGKAVELYGLQQTTIETFLKYIGGMTDLRFYEMVQHLIADQSFLREKFELESTNVSASFFVGELNEVGQRGEGTLYLSLQSGEYLKGKWQDGLKEGDFTFRDKHGSLFKCHFSSDMLTDQQTTMAEISREQANRATLDPHSKPELVRNLGTLLNCFELICGKVNRMSLGEFHECLIRSECLSLINNDSSDILQRIGLDLSDQKAVLTRHDYCEKLYRVSEVCETSLDEMTSRLSENIQRNLDVSSTLELVRRWLPDTVGRMWNECDPEIMAGIEQYKSKLLPHFEDKVSVKSVFKYLWNSDDATEESKIFRVWLSELVKFFPTPVFDYHTDSVSNIRINANQWLSTLILLLISVVSDQQCKTAEITRLSDEIAKAEKASKKKKPGKSGDDSSEITVEELKTMQESWMEIQRREEFGIDEKQVNEPEDWKITEERIQSILDEFPKIEAAEE